ncbi:MAG: hypothetical protein WC655_27715 [Candidatus Hydrogenedentales bacterium]|jgi:hypothetical protein
MTKTMNRAFGCVCGATLIFAAMVVQPYSAGGDIDPLITTIVEKQKAAHDRFTSYEYSASITGFSLDDTDAKVKVDTKCAVTRKGDAFRMTLKHYPVMVFENNAAPPRQEFRETHSVANGDYQAMWMNVEIPFVDIYYRKDWQTEEQQAQLGRLFSLGRNPNPFELAWTVSDGSNTVGDLLANEQRFPVDTRPTWTVETVAGADGTSDYVLKRTSAHASRPDLIVTVDPDKDYVVTKSEFAPDGSEDEIGQVSRTYEKVGEYWCLNRMEQTESEVQGVVESILCEFKIANIPSDAVDASFTVSGLGLPDIALVNKFTQDGKNSRVSASFEYRKGELIPLDDLQRRRSFLIELGIIPEP